MSYISGSERSFTGLGVDLPSGLPTGMLDAKQLSLLKIANPAAYIEYMKKIDAASIAKKLADAAITKLKNDPKYGPVFAAAVNGATDPKAVAEKAKAWGEKMGAGLTNLDKDALRMFYSQAASGIDLLDDYISVNPIARDVMKGIDKGINIFGDTQSIIKSFQKEGIDPSGVADVANLVSNTFSFANSIVQRAASGSKGAKVFGEISEWAGIAMGCAAGIASTGAVGAFGCAATVIVKFFDLLTDLTSGPAQQTTDTRGIPMGIFTPIKEQIPIIAADAIRLASVLKYRYGVKSWAEIADTAPASSEKLQATPTGKYNINFFSLYPKYDPYTAVNLVPTGCTPQDFGKIVRRLICNMFGVDTSVLPYGSTYGSAGFTGRIGELYRYHKYGVDSFRQDFFYYGDADIDGIFAGAEFAQEMGSHAFSKSPFYYSSIFGTKENLRPGYELQEELIYTELVQFFMAVTVHQIQNNLEEIKPLLYGDLPVKYWYCGIPSNPERPWPTTPTEFLDHRFNKTIFTMKYPGDCEKYYPAKYRGDNAVAQSRSGSSCAIREIAHIRLMAAASYLQMMFKWGTKPGYSKGEDMIAGLDDMSTGIPGYMLRMPINPRSKIVNNKMVTPSVGELRAQLAALSKKMTQLQALAKAQAEADKKGKVVAIDSNILAAFQAGTKTATISSSTDALQQMIKSGSLLVETTSASQKRCSDAGGAWSSAGMACSVDSKGNLTNCVPATAATTKKYYCVPAGTPGSTPISGGSSILPFVAIAGAGFLLMQLLKKK